MAPEPATWASLASACRNVAVAILELVIMVFRLLAALVAAQPQPDPSEPKEEDTYETPLLESSDDESGTTPEPPEVTRREPLQPQQKTTAPPPSSRSRRSQKHHWARMISRAAGRHRWATRGLALKWSRNMPKNLDTRPPRGLTIQGQRWGWREIGWEW